MGGGQSKKKKEVAVAVAAPYKSPAADGDVTLDPQSSAALGQRLAQNKRQGGGVMPWNEDNDSEINDREGNRKPSREQNGSPTRTPAIPNVVERGRPPRQAEDSLDIDDIENQILAIENAHQNPGAIPR